MGPIFLGKPSVEWPQSLVQKDDGVGLCMTATSSFSLMRRILLQQPVSRELTSWCPIFHHFVICDLLPPGHTATTFSTEAMNSKPLPVYPLCTQTHFLNQCKEFRRLSHYERLEFVNSKNCAELA